MTICLKPKANLLMAGNKDPNCKLNFIANAVAKHTIKIFATKSKLSWLINLKFINCLNSNIKP